MISQLKHMKSNEFAVSVHGMQRMHERLYTIIGLAELDWITGLPLELKIQHYSSILELIAT